MFNAEKLYGELRQKSWTTQIIIIIRAISPNTESVSNLTNLADTVTLMSIRQKCQLTAFSQLMTKAYTTIPK